LRDAFEASLMATPTAGRSDPAIPRVAQFHIGLVRELPEALNVRASLVPMYPETELRS
jgi:hypothetical protein